MTRSDWDTAAIRQLLREALGDSELTSICFDYFPAVSANLSDSMVRSTKIQHLLEYCVRHDRVQDLLDVVRAENPTQYAYFEPRLRRRGALTGSRALPDAAKGHDEVLDPGERTYGTGNRWAVLVGVNAYEDWVNYGNLRVCVKDVEATREHLIAGRFDPARIRLLTDHTPDPPTRANILVSLKAVADNTEPDDLLLFYYSGHGDEDGGESFLVARDGRRLVLSDTAVSVARIVQIVGAAPARAKVILLDACHSGADIGGKGPMPMSEAFIRRVFEQAEGMAVLASCKQGQLSYEWRESERSVFTHYLLGALRGEADRDGKGFVTVQDASRHVVNGVRLWASQHSAVQTPTLQYTVAGDIILVDSDINDGR